MLPERIRTERTTLRPYRREDVDDVLAYAGDTQWRRYLSSFAAEYTRADAEAFLASHATRDGEVHPMWAIEVEQRVVGGVDLVFSCEHQIGELGYGLAPSVWGRGLALEAARAVIDAAFAHYAQLERIRARTDARNLRSQRVMEKLGMRREALLPRHRVSHGELVDELIYGVLRHEWGS